MIVPSTNGAGKNWTSHMQRRTEMDHWPKVQSYNYKTSRRKPMKKILRPWIRQGFIRIKKAQKAYTYFCLN